MKSDITRNGIVTLVTVGTLAALAPAPPAAAAPVPSGSATRIVLERTGGLTGGRTSFVVDRSTVGGHRPLHMAGSRQFKELRRSYQPENPCCDRYSYRLVVSYRSGGSKSVSTVQGTPAPRILWDVIGQVEQVGVRPLGAGAPA